MFIAYLIRKKKKEKKVNNMNKNINEVIFHFKHTAKVRKKQN